MTQTGAEPYISFGGCTGGASFATRGAVNVLCRGGALEGPVLQQGELSMFCVGLSERDLLRLQNDNFSGMTSRGKDWRGHCGDQANFWGCSSPP